MLCEECHERPATVHYTQIINGKKMEVHLCEVCAKQKQKDFIGPDFSLNNLFQGLFNLPGVTKEWVVPAAKEIKCESCGLTLSDFQSTGMLGCSDCYRSFQSQLNPLIRRIHGSSQHTGKVPKRTGEAVAIKQKIERLKAELDEKVAQEAFEEAAVLRDKIKSLERQVD